MDPKWLFHHALFINVERRFDIQWNIHKNKQILLCIIYRKKNFFFFLCVFLTKYILYLNRIKSIYCYTFYEHRYKIFIEKASRMFFVIQTNRSLTKRKFCAFIMYVCIKRISKFNSTASVFKWSMRFLCTEIIGIYIYVRHFFIQIVFD